MTSTRTRAEEILRASESLFAEKGFHGTTMREVAEAAGVGLSLIVYHFKSKDGLYRAIFESRQYVNEDRMMRLAAVTDVRAPDALERVVAASSTPSSPCTTTRTTPASPGSSCARPPTRRARTAA